MTVQDAQPIADWLRDIVERYDLDLKRVSDRMRFRIEVSDGLVLCKLAGIRHYVEDLDIALGLPPRKSFGRSRADATRALADTYIQFGYPR